MSPVRVHYREAGAGRPIVILHGGWGYEIYPFDRQIAALAETHRVVALREAMAAARFEILADGGHSPHSERATADEVTRLAERFVSDRPGRPGRRGPA